MGTRPYQAIVTYGSAQGLLVTLPWHHSSLNRSPKNFAETPLWVVFKMYWATQEHNQYRIPVAYHEVFDKQLLQTGVNERVHDVIQTIVYASTHEAPTRSPPPQFETELFFLCVLQMDVLMNSCWIKKCLWWIKAELWHYDNPKGWHTDCARFTI